MKTPEGELLISKYSKAFSFLSKHTGMDVKTFYDLFVAYFTLKSDVSFVIIFKFNFDFKKL